MLRLALFAWLALCGVANAQLSGGLQFPGPGTAHSAGGYVGPLDVTGYTGAAAYWGLRCSTSAYTGNVAEIWDAPTGVTTRTLLTCSSGGVLTETVNSLATTCASLCIVGTLYDQVGGSFGDLNTSGSATSRPALARSGVGFGSVPVVQCNGTAALTTTANSPAFTQPFTVSHVMKGNTFGTNGDSFSSGNSIQVQTASANTWLFFAGTVQNFTLNDTLWGAGALVFNGASSTSNVSNSTNNSSATPSGSVNVGANNFDTGSTVGICGRTPVGNGLLFDGYVFETILVSGAVSGANQTTLINNQRAYGGGF